MGSLKYLVLLLIYQSTAFSIPNPASLYCTEHGGKLEIRQTQGVGQYGVCVWAELVDCGDGVCFDYSECEEWAFFRQSCKRWECKEIEVKLGEDGALLTECK